MLILFKGHHTTELSLKAEQAKQGVHVLLRRVLSVK